MLKWDFSALFKSEEELEKFSAELEKKASEFRKEFENKIKNLSPKDKGELLKKYENLRQNLDKIGTYAVLIFSQDTSRGAFYAKYEEICKNIEANLLFFELELCELDELSRMDFIQNSPGYEFYLKNLFESQKYLLSKAEENVILKLSNTGANAFGRLFDETLARLKIPFEGKKLSEEEILSKLYDENRQIRKKAAKKFTKTLDKNANLLGFILNMIRAEKKSICELRSFENAETPRHFNNRISQKSVDALINACEANFHLVSKFYKRKKQILGYSKLKDYDRYAPLGKEANFSYEESQKIVLEAFENFSPEFGKTAKIAFSEGWIDVYPCEKKRGGAFSCSATPDAHPYILLNFTNKRRDLFTLAHELGHTIHQKLSYNVSFLNQDTPLTTAETASVFAEMLIFDHLKNKLEKEELLALYAAKIEDIFATFYRQINFTTFERRIHKAKGELNKEEISQIWMEESQKMFGQSVKLSQNYSLWWAYISHFIHSPFYCYAYAYAQLLVLALYGLYKSGKCENFIELYIKMLSLGGSVSPKELISFFGFDIEDENFWQIGINEIEKLVNEFLELEC